MYIHVMTLRQITVYMYIFINSFINIYRSSIHVFLAARVHLPCGSKVVLAYCSIKGQRVHSINIPI